MLTRCSLRASRIRKRPALLATLALAVAGVGLVVPVMDVPVASAAGLCEAGDLWNPMGAATPIGSDDGYTVFVTGDALLANQELEGSIAVAGTLTFGSTEGNGSAQYPIVHKIAGSDAYDLPTIDGAPNRVLINRYAPGTRDVTVQVKAQGAVSAGHTGGAKIFDLTEPAGYVLRSAFEAGGTTFYPSGGSNMSPQFSSWVQQWDGGAGAATFTPAEPRFADYFEEDSGTALLSQSGIWVEPLAFPSSGQDITVTLDPSGPNRVALSDFAGVMKFSLVGYSPTSPLIVQVNPEDVVNGEILVPSVSQAGKDGDMANYVLFDLSEITGAVTFKTPNEPIRGAIYAPHAHIVVPNDGNGGREFEGQVIAQQFSDYASKEIHTNLFQGVLPCVTTADATGGFTVTKVVVDESVTGVESTRTYTFEYSIDGGVTWSALAPVAGGGSVQVEGLADGTVVQLREVVPTGLPGGVVWDGVSFSPGSSFVIDTETSTDQAVTATNTFSEVEAVTGGFTVTKAVVDDSATGVESSRAYAFEYSVDGGEWTALAPIAADGSVSVTGLADGAVVQLREVVPTGLPEGVVWDGVAFSTGSSFVIDTETSTDLAVTATNTFSEVEAVTGGFTVTKVVADESVTGVESTRTYVFEYSVDGGATWSALAPVVGGGSVQVEGLADGTVVQLREVAPTGLPEGVVWDGVSFSPGSSFVIDTDTTTDLAVTATNTFSEVEAVTGGFTVNKAVVDDSTTGVESTRTYVFEYSVDGGTWTTLAPVGAGGSVPVTGLADGAVVELREVAPTGLPEGVVWDGVSFSPGSSFVIDVETTTDVAVTATNTFSEAEAVTGGFTVTKAVVDDSTTGVESSRAYAFEYSVDGGEWTALAPIAADGSVSVTGLADGAVVQLREVVPTGLPERVVWDGVTFSTGSSFVIDTETSTDVAVTATNTFSEAEAATGGFTVTKAVVDDSTTGVDASRTYVFEYSVDRGEWTALTPVAEGGSVQVEDLADGTVVEVREVVPAGLPEGLVWDGVTFSPGNSFVIDTDTTTALAITATNTFSDDDGEQPATGGFSLSKVLVGLVPTDFAPDTSFEIRYSVNGEEAPEPIRLSADGTIAVGPQDLEAGSVVMFQEVTPTNTPSGFEWTGATVVPASLTVGQGVDALVTVTNSYVEQDPSVGTGGFSMAKVVAGLDVADLPVGALFEVEYFLDGALEAAGSVVVGADGAVVAGPQDLAVGTVVTFGEVTPSHTPVGFAWTGGVFSPAAVTVGQGVDALVTVTNTYVVQDPGADLGGFRIHKEISGDGASLVPSGMFFTVDYFVDGATAPTGTLQLPADGTVISVAGLTVGQTVTFVERTPIAIAGSTWGTPVFSPGSIVISASGTDVTLTNTLTPNDDGGDEPEPDDDGRDEPEPDGDGSDDGDDDLAVTGVETVALGVFVSLLLGAGTFLVLLSRRQRRQV